MAIEYVAVGVAIAGDVTVELPFAPELVSQQPVVGTGRHTIDRVVAAGAMLFRKTRRH